MDIFIILLKTRTFDEHIHHFNQRLAMQLNAVFTLVNSLLGLRAKGLRN